MAGRAARNLNGRVILYADVMTDSITAMIEITDERRQRQVEFNEKHGIVPESIQKELRAPLVSYEESREIASMAVREEGVDFDAREVLEDLRREMLEAAGNLEFKRAAIIRDDIRSLEKEMKKDS